jgi:hypothetical protein
MVRSWPDFSLTFGGAAPDSAARWRRALAAFRRAERILKAAAHEPDEDRYDAINGAFHRALRRLLRTPAPDLRALSLKIDLAVDHEIAELTGGDRCLAVLKADARRLARQADRLRPGHEPSIGAAPAEERWRGLSHC